MPSLVAGEAVQTFSSNFYTLCTQTPAANRKALKGEMCPSCGWCQTHNVRKELQNCSGESNYFPSGKGNKMKKDKASNRCFRYNIERNMHS
jgi:hypothetical protein